MNTDFSANVTLEEAKIILHHHEVNYNRWSEDEPSARAEAEASAWYWSLWLLQRTLIDEHHL